uniref:2'-5' oligoadenylate synthase n=1 Tax=Chelonoidis abingdonii TaxID=106734 RepID=A0A8C0IS36_CHEAB
MALDLYRTPAQKLDKFIFDVLQPDSTFLRQAGQAINTICEFLKKNCFADCPPPRIKVLKVVKGGSLGKGTSLKDSSDADLLVFLNCFKGYGDQETNRAGIIKEIKRMLEKCQQEKHFEVFIEQSRWPNPRVLSFKMSSETLDESIEIDVLPAYNALSSGAKPMSQVYEELIQSCSRGGEFSTCFTELQRDFVVDRRTKVKSLIRLVKYWYKQGESLPPQYALELLSVYAWEQGSKDRAFNMAEGFRTVLELIQQYKHLCVYWTINYNFADDVLAGFLHHQLQKARPIILDPADPTGIVGEGSRWDLVAQEAEVAPFGLAPCWHDTRAGGNGAPGASAASLGLGAGERDKQAQEPRDIMGVGGGGRGPQENETHCFAINFAPRLGVKWEHLKANCLLSEDSPALLPPSPCAVSPPTQPSSSDFHLRAGGNSTDWLCAAGGEVAMISRCVPWHSEALPPLRSLVASVYDAFSLCPGVLPLSAACRVIYHVHCLGCVCVCEG